MQRLRLSYIYLGLSLVGLLVLLKSAWAFYVPGGQAGRLKLIQLAQAAVPERIVSMAPAITETLFAIQAGSKVRGVTDYCNYPPEVKKLPKIGAYYDPNYETIVRLRPDLVVLLPEHQEHRQRLQYLNISTLTVEMHSLAGIMSSYIQLGGICQREAQGIFLAESLRREIIKARSRTKDLPRKRVMLVIGRDYQAPKIQEVYIAGRGEFYDELLQLAGGENVFTRTTPKYPKLSVEGILALDPDIIIELIPDPNAFGKNLEKMYEEWSQLTGLITTETIQVKILSGDYLVIPGPRLPLLLDALIKLLHPEIYTPSYLPRFLKGERVGSISDLSYGIS